MVVSSNRLPLFRTEMVTLFKNAETSVSGLSQIVLDDQLRGSDPNPAGVNSYPIVSLTWVLAHPEHEKNDTMKEVFGYMLSDESQGVSDSMGYVPLPESIRDQEP